MILSIRQQLAIAVLAVGCSPHHREASPVSRNACAEAELSVGCTKVAYLTGNAKGYRVGAENVIVAARAYERDADDAALQGLLGELVAAENDAPGGFRTLIVGVAESLAQFDVSAAEGAFDQLPDAGVDATLPFMVVAARGSDRVHYLRAALALTAAGSLANDPSWLGTGHIPWEQALCEHASEFDVLAGPDAADFLSQACDDEDGPSMIPGEGPISPYSDLDCSLGRYNSTRADEFFEALHACMESIVSAEIDPLANGDEGGGGDGGGGDGGGADGGEQEPPPDDPEPVETTETENEDGSTTTRTTYDDGTVVETTTRPDSGNVDRSIQHPDGSRTIVMEGPDKTIIMRFGADSSLIEIEELSHESDSGSSIRADAGDPDDFADLIGLTSDPNGVPTPECLGVLEVLDQMPPSEREALLEPVINPDPTQDPPVDDETFACLGGAVDLQIDDYDASCGLQMCALGSVAIASKGCECERVSATAIANRSRLVDIAACATLRCDDGNLPSPFEDGTCACPGALVTALPAGNPLGLHPIDG